MVVLSSSSSSSSSSLSGYIVSSGLRRTNGVQGLRIVVQSDRDVDYVERRTEAFLVRMQVYIQSYPVYC